MIRCLTTLALTSTFALAACGGPEDGLATSEDEIFGTGGGGSICQAYGSTARVTNRRGGVGVGFCRGSGTSRAVATVISPTDYDMPANTTDAKYKCGAMHMRVSVYGKRGSFRNHLGSSGWVKPVFVEGTPGGFPSKHICYAIVSVEIDRGAPGYYDRLEVTGEVEKYSYTSYRYYYPPVPLDITLQNVSPPAL